MLDMKLGHWRKRHNRLHDLQDLREPPFAALVGTLACMMSAEWSLYFLLAK